MVDIFSEIKNSTGKAVQLCDRQIQVDRLFWAKYSRIGLEGTIALSGKKRSYFVKPLNLGKQEGQSKYTPLGQRLEKPPKEAFWAMQLEGQECF